MRSTITAAERARLVRMADLLHGGLIAALAVLRPLVWDGDPASPANLVYLTVIVLALIVLGGEILAGGRRELRWSWTGAAFALLVVALIPAALCAPIPADGAAFGWQLVLHLGLGFYFSQAVPGRERIAWSALVTAVVGEAVIGWMQGLYVLPTMLRSARGGDAAMIAEGVPSGDLIERVDRGGWFGTFTLSNTFAAWLLVAAVPLIALVRRSRIAALLALATGGLFLATRSKGALVAAGAAAGIWWWWTVAGRWRWLPMPLLALAIALVATVPDIRSGIDASARVRIGYWEGAAALVREAPLAGLGWGAFAERSPGVLPLWAEPSRLVHNEPLEAAVIAGIPVAVLLLLALAMAAWPRRTDREPLADGPSPHPTAAIGVGFLVLYGCALGMLDGNLGWWPGGENLVGQALWGGLLGAGLGAVLVFAGRLPLPPRSWLRLGLAACALHCLVDFNLHSFGVVGTILIAVVLAGGTVRRIAVGRLAGGIMLALTAVLVAGWLRWAVGAIDLRQVGDQIRTLRLVADPAHAEEGLAALAAMLGREAPQPGDPRARDALVEAAIDDAYARAVADPALQLQVLSFRRASAERLARLDALAARLPWSTVAARLQADDLAHAGRWDEAVAAMRRAVALAPASLQIRQDLERLLASAATGDPLRAVFWLAAKEAAERERKALEPVVDYRNRIR